jgi:tetratricopeptide (TPR) repeat protein
VTGTGGGTRDEHTSLGGVITSGPPPKGTLATWPLPTLFVHVIEHRLSGSLVLESPAGDVDLVVFAEGAPTRVRTARLVAPLGEMLVRYGVLADVDLESALARAGAAKRPIGQQLVTEKKIDRRILLKALREQVMVRLRRIAAIGDEAIYEFHGNSDLLDEGSPTGATTADPLAALLALVRAWPNRARIDAELSPLAERRVVVHRDATIDRFELDDAERIVLDRILGGTSMTFGSLLRSTLAPAETIRALLYALTISHHLEVGDDRFPLDVEPSDDPLQALRDSSLNAGVGGERTSNVRREIAASEDHREAEILLRAGNLAEAEELARRAVTRDATKPAFRALLGHVLATRDLAKNERQARKLLDSAIQDDPRADRALVFRARLHESAGRTDEAMKDYRAAVALNPSNAEAATAIRGGVRDPLRASAWRKGPQVTPQPSPVPPEVQALLQKSSPLPPPPTPETPRWVTPVTAALVVATVVLLAFYLATGH